MTGWQIVGLAVALWCAAAVPAAILFARLVRHGEEQDRQTRHTDPHAAYWGRDTPTAPPAPDRPAHGQTRHRRDR